MVLCDGAFLDVCDFPQIAAAMGVESSQRNTAFPGCVEPGQRRTTPRLRCRGGSPYALSTTDGAGHIRKFEALESEIIRMALLRYDGHMSEVARRLGIGRSTLYRKLKEFGLEGSVSGGDTAETETAIEEALRKAG